ncbi:MAG TPA: GNAT family N-acetyltransferase [Prosthecobacter sp.]|nr:GNAT family N-acetyltransferase [Prosthecobacter sp.]
MSSSFRLRLATPADIPVLETLIALSVRGLHGPWYTPAQMEAALGTAFGVDRHLIQDGTYFVVENEAQMIVGCGGWSRRAAMYGGDRNREGQDAFVDPLHEPARIRAFFVHPDWARRGIGRLLLQACEEAIAKAGFQQMVMVATLAGEPLYAAHGYAADERYEAPLPNGLTLPVVRMSKAVSSGTQSG